MVTWATVGQRGEPQGELGTILGSQITLNDYNKAFLPCKWLLLHSHLSAPLAAQEQSYIMYLY